MQPLKEGETSYCVFRYPWHKLGMTQVFDETGKAIPVTVVQAGSCTVTQIKTKQTDSYSAIQIGYRK